VFHRNLEMVRLLMPAVPSRPGASARAAPRHHHRRRDDWRQRTCSQAQQILSFGYVDLRASSVPEDFIARLAALVPKPRAHLTRYHGVFAPASPDRARIVPKTRAAAANRAKDSGEASAAGRQRALTWAQRLKRVFATFGVASLA
jgi:hypothetical protein